MQLYFKELEHPLRQEILEVRKIILDARTGITEHIKWNAPSYCVNGEDRLTFNLRGKDFFRLILHCGVKIKARKLKGKIESDKNGLLEWAADDRAIIRFTDIIDIMQKKPLLTSIIQEWLKKTS